MKAKAMNSAVRSVLDRMGKSGTLTVELQADMKEALRRELVEGEGLDREQEQELLEKLTELLEPMLGKSLIALSAGSIRAQLARSRALLDEMPTGLRLLAKTIGRASHIYEMGMASSEVAMAMTTLDAALSRLDHLVECDECTQPKTEEIPS